MTRKERKELEALSQELFGAPSRYKKLFKKPSFSMKTNPVTGKSVRVSEWRSGEQAIEIMLQLKADREATERAQQLSKDLGGSAE